MVKPKNVHVHPWPFQARFRDGRSWVAVESVSEQGGPLTWRWAVCLMNGKAAHTYKTADQQTVAQLVDTVRLLDVSILCLTSADWAALEPEFKKPVVPVNELVVEYFDQPTRSICC